MSDFLDGSRPQSQAEPAGKRNDRPRSTPPPVTMTPAQRMALTRYRRNHGLLVFSGWHVREESVEACIEAGEMTPEESEDPKTLAQAIGRIFDKYTRALLK